MKYKLEKLLAELVERLLFFFFFLFFLLICSIRKYILNILYVLDGEIFN